MTLSYLLSSFNVRLVRQQSVPERNSDLNQNCKKSCWKWQCVNKPNETFRPPTHTQLWIGSSMETQKLKAYPCWLNPELLYKVTSADEMSRWVKAHVGVCCVRDSSSILAVLLISNHYNKTVTCTLLASKRRGEGCWVYLPLQSCRALSLGSTHWAVCLWLAMGNYRFPCSSWPSNAVSSPVLFHDGCV